MDEPMLLSTGSTPSTPGPRTSSAGDIHGDIHTRVLPCPCQTPQRFGVISQVLALPYAEVRLPHGGRPAMDLQLQQTGFQQ